MTVENILKNQQVGGSITGPGLLTNYSEEKYKWETLPPFGDLMKGKTGVKLESVEHLLKVLREMQ